MPPRGQDAGWVARLWLEVKGQAKLLDTPLAFGFRRVALCPRGVGPRAAVKPPKLANEHSRFGKGGRGPFP